MNMLRSLQSHPLHLDSFLVVFPFYPDTHPNARKSFNSTITNEKSLKINFIKLLIRVEFWYNDAIK